MAYAAVTPLRGAAAVMAGQSWRTQPRKGGGGSGSQVTGSSGGAFGAGGDASQVATGTAQSNLAAAPYNVQLADIINATNRAAQQSANNARLGPQGQQIQSNLMTNAERASQGLLDPQTEAMLQQGIAARGQAAGFGVDSANLSAAYQRAIGDSIGQRQALGQQNYLDLLRENPSAPIYGMQEGNINPQTYASTATTEAARRMAADQFNKDLAYKYAALARSGGGRGGGGGAPSYSPVLSGGSGAPASNNLGDYTYTPTPPKMDASGKYYDLPTGNTYGNVMNPNGLVPSVNYDGTEDNMSNDITW